MTWVTITCGGYVFPAIPEAEATDDDLYRDDLDECWGLGEDVEELIDDFVDDWIWWSTHPKDYADWAEKDEDNPPEPPYVTSLRS